MPTATSLRPDAPSEGAGGVSAPTSAAGVLQAQAQAEVGREGGALSPELSGCIGAKRGGGQPLDATVRRGLEGVFGVSFGHVRIHADPEADALNRGVAAIVFTVGADIFFRAGAYQPHSAAGQHLLAHELTHVVQQRTGSLGTGGGGNAGGTMTVGAADDRHEQEAEATAHRVTAALQRRALMAQATTPGAGIARQHDPTMMLTPAAQGVRPAPLPGQDPPVFPVSFPAIVYYPGGANVHTHPAVGSPVVALLPSLTTRVMVTGKTTTSKQAGGTPDWYEVRVSAGPHAGTVGFLQHFRVDSRWPTGDPDPTLYVIQPGDTALGLAARFYGLQGSDHPETNADLRRYVEVLVRVNQHGSYWIEHGNDGDPLTWMRAQVRATYAMWVPSRAWAGKVAGAVPNPSLTGGAWATVHQQLQAQGWGGVNILQAVSLFAQDVAVVGDRAVGALRHAIVVSGTLLGEVTAETARAVLPVLQDLASAAVAPAVLMATLGALAAKKLADVPAALLALLERKAHELLASLLGAPVLARLGGAVQAILTDPGTFIGNLVAALNAGVGHLIDHVKNHFGEDALGWLIGKLGAGIHIPRSLALADLLPTVQDMLGLTRTHLRDLVVRRIVHTQRVSAQQAGQIVDRAGDLAARLDSLAHEAWGAAAGGQAPRLIQRLVDGVRDGLRDWLWGQLIRLGLKVLVELSTPLVGEVIALIQAVYAAVQTFLQYEGTLKDVFGTIVGTFADLAEHKDAAMAIRIGQGVIGPTLVSLIVPALDFLAGLFGLGKIADGVQHVLQAARSKVDHALTPLIAALADAVRGVAGGRGHDGQDAPGATPHQDNPKHEVIAQQIVTKLEHIDGAPKDFAATRSAKEGQAHQLWSVYHGQLERGINLSITFATTPDDAGGKETLDFTVVIAPNTTKLSGRILVAPPGTAPTHVTYQTLSGNRAHWVHALPLTLQPGNTKGSSPYQSPPGWSQVVIFDRDITNKNRTPAVYGPLDWEQLHLLSEMFHGPGAAWNLVPGRKADNNWMTRNPEQDVKSAFGAEPHATLSYRTEATYFAASDGDNNPAHVSQRVEIENFVKSIHIEWFHVKLEHGVWVKDTSRPPRMYDRTLEKPPLLLPPPDTIPATSINATGWEGLRDRLDLGPGLAQNIVKVRNGKLYLAPGVTEGRFIDWADFLRRMTAFYTTKGIDFVHRDDLWPTINERISQRKVTL